MTADEFSSARRSRAPAATASSGREQRASQEKAIPRYWLLAIAVAVSCVAGAAATRPTPDAKPAGRYKFEPNTVLELARRLSASAYSPQKLDGSPALQQLTYDQYRDIRFNAEAGIWRNEQVPFRVELLPAGFLFQSPVRMTLVENQSMRDVIAAPGMFTFGPSVPKQVATQNLPLSGFRVRTRLNSRSVWDEFLVFQGASYFRAVQRGGAYGLSARGLAIRTA